MNADVEAAFDVDAGHEEFYDRFKTEHAAFLKFIKGIHGQADLEWYASLMLNRLMFVYFIQKKGFLDGDPDYLRNRLKRVRQTQGQRQVPHLLPHFLLRLFHEGLGKAADRERRPDRAARQRAIPQRRLFRACTSSKNDHDGIEIPDEAFERLFDFFDRYQWHLDDRPLRTTTRSTQTCSATSSRSTSTRSRWGRTTRRRTSPGTSARTRFSLSCSTPRRTSALSRSEPQSFFWRLLRDDPDRYIHGAVRHGVIDDARVAVIPVPSEIATGMEDASKRGGWNRPATESSHSPPRPGEST